MRSSHPLRTLARVTITGAAALLLVVPAASAASFKITMKNGHVFESRYQPRQAEWDASMVVFIDDVGVPIALYSDDVDTIASSAEDRGYGRVIDSTTLEFGFAPNDLPVPDPNAPAGAGEGADPLAAFDDTSGRQYDQQQFVEPGTASGGFPVFGASGGAAPSGGSVQGVEPINP